MRVLVVDDEPMVRDVLARYLEADGFEVDTAGDGATGARPVRRRPSPDLVLLDLMLPRDRRARGDAPACARARDVPVILLTARGRGGRPHRRARARRRRLRDEAVLAARGRRARAGGAPPGDRGRPTDDRGPDVLEFGDLTIDRERREARRGDEPDPAHRARSSSCSTSSRRSPGVTFSRTELLEDVWDFAWDGDPSTVTVHVRRLREKIEDDPSTPAPRHGVGRRLPVRAVSAPRARCCCWLVLALIGGRRGRCSSALALGMGGADLVAPRGFPGARPPASTVAAVALAAPLLAPARRSATGSRWSPTVGDRRRAGEPVRAHDRDGRLRPRRGTRVGGCSCSQRSRGRALALVRRADRPGRARAARTDRARARRRATCRRARVRWAAGPTWTRLGASLRPDGRGAPGRAGPRARGSRRCGAT